MQPMKQKFVEETGAAETVTVVAITGLFVVLVALVSYFIQLTEQENLSFRQDSDISPAVFSEGCPDGAVAATVESVASTAGTSDVILSAGVLENDWNSDFDSDGIISDMPVRLISVPSAATSNVGQGSVLRVALSLGCWKIV